MYTKDIDVENVDNGRITGSRLHKDIGPIEGGEYLYWQVVGSKIITAVSLKMLKRLRREVIRSWL